jgi:hypothetical protein
MRWGHAQGLAFGKTGRAAQIYARAKGRARARRARKKMQRLRVRSQARLAAQMGSAMRMGLELEEGAPERATREMVPEKEAQSGR